MARFHKSRRYNSGNSIRTRSRVLTGGRRLGEPPPFYFYMNTREFRLFWIREIGVDRLEASLGAAVDAASLFPTLLAAAHPHGSSEEQETQRAIVRRLCDRILDFEGTAWPLELHLPYWQPPEWRNRFALLDSLQFVHHSGRIEARQPAGEWERHAGALVALGAPWRADLHFDFPCTTPLERLCVTRLFAAFELGPPPAGAKCTFRVGIDARRGEVLRRGPAEFAPNYFSVYVKLAQALQNMLRIWIPFFYFQDEARTRNAVLGRPVLGYGCSWPASGRRPTEFTYDTFDRESMALAARIGRPRMALAMRQVFTAARAMAPSDPTRPWAGYEPRRVKNALATLAQKVPFQRLLRNDDLVVSAFVDLALRIRAASSDRVRAEAAWNCVRRVQHALRHAVRDLDLSPIALVLVFECVAALDRALGGNLQIDVSAESILDGGEHLLHRKAGELRPPDHANRRTSRSPNLGIRRAKENHRATPAERREVGDAGIISDVERSSGDPIAESS